MYTNADLLALRRRSCLWLALMLCVLLCPLAARATSAAWLMVAGTDISTGGYYCNTPSGGITQTGATADNYNVYYDPAGGTLYLRNAALKSGIVAQGGGGKLTICVLGESTVQSGADEDHCLSTAGLDVTLTGGKLNLRVPSATKDRCCLYAFRDLTVQKGAVLDVKVGTISGRSAAAVGVAVMRGLVNDGTIHVTVEAAPNGTALGLSVNSSLTNNGQIAVAVAKAKTDNALGVSVQDTLTNNAGARLVAHVQNVQDSGIAVQAEKNLNNMGSLEGRVDTPAACNACAGVWCNGALTNSGGTLTGISMPQKGADESYGIRAETNLAVTDGLVRGTAQLLEIGGGTDLAAGVFVGESLKLESGGRLEGEAKKEKSGSGVGLLLHQLEGDSISGSMSGVARSTGKAAELTGISLNNKAPATIDGGAITAAIHNGNENSVGLELAEETVTLDGGRLERADARQRGYFAGRRLRRDRKFYIRDRDRRHRHQCKGV